MALIIHIIYTYLINRPVKYLIRNKLIKSNLSVVSIEFLVVIKKIKVKRYSNKRTLKDTAGARLKMALVKFFTPKYFLIRGN